MNIYFKVGLVIISIIAYIILINFIASIFFRLKPFENPDGIITSENSAFQNVGVSDSVSVLVMRPRWYGNINEHNGDSYIYLFSLVKLPLKVEDHGFLRYHIIFLFLLAFFLFLAWKKI